MTSKKNYTEKNTLNGKSNKEDCKKWEKTKEYMQTMMQRKGKEKSRNNMDMQIKREQSLINVELSLIHISRTEQDKKQGRSISKG